jgi:hypothetical protein
MNKLGKVPVLLIPVGKMDSKQSPIQKAVSGSAKFCADIKARDA